MWPTAIANSINANKLGKSMLLPIVAVTLFAATYVVEGVFRFALVGVGFSGGVYLRDFVVLGFSTFALIMYSFKPGLPLRYWVISGLTIIHFGIGLINLGVAQTLFGMKILATFVTGMSLGLAPHILENKYAKLFVVMLFFVACIGVYINRYTSFPWEGLSYSIGDIEVASSRIWWSGGISRLAGFGRVSVDTAITIAVLALTACSYKLPRHIKFLIMCMALAAAYLTTTKAVILALIIIMPFSVFGLKCVGPFVTRLSLMVSFCIAFLVPMIALFVYSNFGMGMKDLPVQLSSFSDRIVNTWPMAIELVKNDFSWIWGRGIGGIGAAQRFEGVSYNPADNIVIFGIVTFGLAGLVYLYALVVSVPVTVVKRHDVATGVAVLSTLFFLLAGITTNMFGNPLAVLALGFTSVYVIRGKETDDA